MVPAPAHMLQTIILLQQPYMGKRCRLAAECCFHKFFLAVVGSSFPECPATRRRGLFHPEPPMTFVLPYVYRPITPLSRHQIEPVPECSDVGDSHHLIDGQSVFHPHDQGVQRPLVLKTAYSQCPSSNLYAPSPAKSRNSMGNSKVYR